MSNTLDFPLAVSYASTETGRNPISWVLLVTGTLSIMGCIFNIAVTVRLGRAKLIIGKMVITLAVFGLIKNIPSVFISFHATTSRYTCETIGGWIQYFGNASSLFFTTCFAHAYYHSLDDIECIKKHYKKYLALSIISGVILGSLSVILGFREHAYTSKGRSVCLVVRDSKFQWEISFILVTIAVVNIIGCALYYIRIIKKLRSLHGELKWGLMLYPLFLIICETPWVVRRIMLSFGFDFTSPVNYEINHALLGLLGFFNSLAYGLSKEIYEALKRHCSSRSSEKNQNP